MATLVLTVIGNDRTGIVAAIADAITDHHGNWLESQMSELAGKFAGILTVGVADSKAAALTDALEALEGPEGLNIVVERAGDDAGDSSPAARTGTIELFGPDRPGIVHELSEALAGRSISVAGLETSTSEAPMSGGQLFEATVEIELPRKVESTTLGDVLDALADELGVDIELRLEARS